MGQGRIGLVNDRGIVKFMPPQPRACRVAGHWRGKGSMTIAQVHFAPLKRCNQPQQPQHFMPRARRINQPRAHCHIAPTFAMHGFGLGKGLHAYAEILRARQNARM